MTQTFWMLDCRGGHFQFGSVRFDFYKKNNQTECFFFKKPKPNRNQFKPKPNDYIYIYIYIFGFPKYKN
jgi:hypothetical protein